MAEQVGNGQVRIETDSMGDRPIPSTAYYGIQTQRAMENFPISGLKPLPTYVDACVLIKKATAIANGELDCIPQDISQAIIQATDEILKRRPKGSICRRCVSSGCGHVPPYERQ